LICNAFAPVLLANPVNQPRKTPTPIANAGASNNVNLIPFVDINTVPKNHKISINPARTLVLFLDSIRYTMPIIASKNNNDPPIVEMTLESAASFNSATVVKTLGHNVECAADLRESLPKGPETKIESFVNPFINPTKTT